jgi:nucleoid DNA-binding protein
MNKTEFVGHVAKRAEATHAESQRFVQAVLDEVLEALKKGEDVAFAGFGKFSVSHRAARTGVNPQDPSKKVSIPARVVPRFTPGAVLKEQVATGNAKKPAPKKK